MCVRHHHSTSSKNDITVGNTLLCDKIVLKTGMMKELLKKQAASDLHYQKLDDVY
jgi:hypothetical protein